MYKIYYNDAKICIVNQMGAIFSDKDRVDIILYNGEVEVFYPQLKNFLSTDNLDFLYIVAGSLLDDCWNKFCAYFKTIQAAGGYVLNQKGLLLCMKRLGFWDLPKGKIEKNELPTLAAIREVEEETGIKVYPERLTPICITYHIYFFKEKWILKFTHWYKMEAINLDTTAQIEENIELVSWQEIETMRESKPIYHNIIDVLDAVKSFQNQSN